MVISEDEMGKTLQMLLKNCVVTVSPYYWRHNLRKPDSGPQTHLMLHSKRFLMWQSYIEGHKFQDNFSLQPVKPIIIS